MEPRSEHPGEPGARGEPPPGTDQPPIADYGIIGDCRTAALVSRSGSIDWYCLPRFDSASVFGALLDTRLGGCFAVRPVGPFRTERRYLPDTNVLETTFHADSGTVRLTDAMTLGDGGSSHVPSPSLAPDHEILRRVECVEGRVRMEVVCDPRFDYGRRVPDGKDQGPLGIHFDGGADAVVLRSEVALERRPGRAGWGARFTIDQGDRRRFSLTSGHAAPPVLCQLGDAADARLERTAEWWREWVRKCAYRGPHRDRVFRSMLALKLLMYPPSGAILAALTTSLPEVPGGERNWDYRFCWLRDASMTLEVLLHLGFQREGEAFLGWLLHATRLTRPELQVLYDLHGRTDHPERHLDHLAGYHGSRPVRSGNGAVGQLQLDLYGELLRAAWAFVEQGGTLDRAEAGLLSDLGETVCTRWREPDNGIWELRDERRPFTLSKAMCWVALDCLLRLHDDGHLPLERDRASVVAEQQAIRARVERDGWNDDLGSYVAWFGGEEVDAALLLLGIMGYEDPGSDRIRGTLERVRGELEENGLLYRYRYDDNLPGREGAFTICAFWEAELLARQRHLEAAEERFRRACSVANDLGLFSEQVDPRTGELLGNVPQAFSHIGLLSAAAEIARARGTPPERRAGEPETTEPETESEASS